MSPLFFQEGENFIPPRSARPLYQVVALLLHVVFQLSGGEKKVLGGGGKGKLIASLSRKFLLWRSPKASARTTTIYTGDHFSISLFTGVDFPMHRLFPPRPTAARENSFSPFPKARHNFSPPPLFSFIAVAFHRRGRNTQTTNHHQSTNS